MPYSRQFGKLEWASARRIHGVRIWWDFNADLLQRTLRDLNAALTALTPREQSEALQCVLKGVSVHPSKLQMEVFALGGVPPKFAET